MKQEDRLDYQKRVIRKTSDVFNCYNYMDRVWLMLLPLSTLLYKCFIVVITGPPNGPVLFCWLASVVCNAAGGRAGRPPGTWMVGVPAAGRVGVQAANTVRRASHVTSR